MELGQSIWIISHFGTAEECLNKASAPMPLAGHLINFDRKTAIVQIPGGGLRITPLAKCYETKRECEQAILWVEEILHCRLDDG